MSKIILLKNTELWLLKELLFKLKRDGRTAQLEEVKMEVKALKSLARIISRYPSIVEAKNIGKPSFHIGNLVDNLCRKNEYNILFNMPTKAILGKSYLIAKLNFFYRLLHLTNEVKELSPSKQHVTAIISDIIFSLMAEELFLEIISDPHQILHVRINAGIYITKIWEYRLTYGIKEFSPLLANIWKARETISPVYGTLLGTAEMFQLSNKIDPKVREFFSAHSFSEDEDYSLQEFLFGIRYENILILKKKMKEMDKTVVTRDEIKLILKKDKLASGCSKNGGPREFYSFFVDRKINAIHRAKTHVKGPKKTIEEHIMSYLLQRMTPEECNRI